MTAWLLTPAALATAYAFTVAALGDLAPAARLRVRMRAVACLFVALAALFPAWRIGGS